MAAFLTEIFALGTAAPDASVIVPDSVAPLSCARNGPEIPKRSRRIPAPAMNFAAFGFIYLDFPHSFGTDGRVSAKLLYPISKSKYIAARISDA